MIRIAAAISAVRLWLEALDSFGRQQSSYRSQVIQQLVAVGIDVRVDVVSNQASYAAES
ncbi:MAG: hypothetical protein ACLP9L_29785 [Thermoguttaceae bacterium]